MGRGGYEFFKSHVKDKKHQCIVKYVLVTTIFRIPKFYFLQITFFGKFLNKLRL